MRLPGLGTRPSTSARFSADQLATIQDVWKGASPQAQYRARVLGPPTVAVINRAEQPSARGVYTGSLLPGQERIDIAPELPLDDFRRTLAHEFQHYEQDIEDPSIFNDYAPASWGRPYIFHPAELQARAASWVEDKRVKAPLLFERPALAKALGSKDWEFGPPLLGEDPSYAFAKRPLPVDALDSLHQMMEGFDPNASVYDAAPTPIQPRLPFGMRDRIDNMKQLYDHKKAALDTVLGRALGW